MFRIASHISASRICLLRHSIDQRIASISRSTTRLKYGSPKERDPCLPPPPPPPPPPRDLTLFLGVVGFLIASGAFTVYAKTNPELRDWLTINAPWLDDFIAYAYQENLTYTELAIQVTEHAKNALVSYLRNDKPKQCSADGSMVPFVQSAPEGWKDKKDEVDDDKEDHCDKMPPPDITKDIGEIHTCLKDFGDAALFNYMTCRDACDYYNKLVEETMLSFSVENFNELKAAMVERQDLVKESSVRANCANSKFDELTKYIECGGVQAPKEDLQKTKDLLKEYDDKIKNVKTEYQIQNDMAIIMDSQVQKVEEVLTKYTEENEAMFAGLKYNNNKLTMKGDLDLLLHHTLRYVEKLKTELSETASSMTERINRGLESLPQGTVEKTKRDKEIAALYAKRKTALDYEFKNRIELQRVSNDNLLRNSLKEQIDRHEKNLKTKLQNVEIEAKVKLEEMVNKTVAAERNMMEQQLNEMCIKVVMIQDKLDVRIKNGVDIKSYCNLTAYLKRLSDGFRSKKSKMVLSSDDVENFIKYAPDNQYLATKVGLIFGVTGACRIQVLAKISIKDVENHVQCTTKLKAEQDTRRSQELWSAGASLLAATQKGDPYVNVDQELKAIEKASADGDKLVQTVLKAIPQSVRERGVVPESVLKQKYRVMESTAMKVALVEQDGAPLPVYIMSLLQYMFLFMKISGIPQEEYEKPPNEPCKHMDTFDLLQRARFWMERGNISAALRYVNALRGASLAASAGWRRAASEHLETRQAAEAVLAHARALALQYV